MKPIHAALAGLLAASPALADVRLLASGGTPPDATDSSGLTGTLSKPDGTPVMPMNTLGAYGSGIAWTGVGTSYVAIPDRGPLDGATDYRVRFHEMLIAFTRTTTVGPGSGVVAAQTTATRFLTDESGRELVGRSAAFEPGDGGKSRRFDPESIRPAPGGKTFYISDEYGPWVAEFSAEGRMLRRFETPPALLAERAGADEAAELPPSNTRGRAPNRGFEGLAVTPDGKTVFAALQSPAIQDHAFDDKGKRAGVNVRIVRFDATTGKPTAQFVYTLSSPKHSICEILAVDGTRLLVLERDGEAGYDAKFKRILVADTASASDVSAVESLPATGLPEGVRPMSTTTFLDLLAPRFGLASPEFPAKVEAITFGPPTSTLDGETRRTLIVASDNDFKNKEASFIWVFGFLDEDLPGIVDPQPPAATPATPSAPAAPAGAPAPTDAPSVR
jgi:hypothetical protein